MLFFTSLIIFFLNFALRQVLIPKLHLWVRAWHNLDPVLVRQKKSGYQIHVFFHVFEFKKMPCQYRGRDRIPYPPPPLPRIRVWYVLNPDLSKLKQIWLLFH